ncbi:MAG: Ig-like domain-containing protein [Candidatus Paceibacterota bacterium]
MKLFYGIGVALLVFGSLTGLVLVRAPRAMALCLFDPCTPTCQKSIEVPANATAIKTPCSLLVCSDSLGNCPNNSNYTSGFTCNSGYTLVNGQCILQCPASGICPATPSGSTCNGWTNGSPVYPTVCSSVATTATCNSGTWSGTLPTTFTCSQYCAASGSCPSVVNGTYCGGYSTSSATSPTLCSSYANNSTCQSTGLWSPTPTPAYSTCTQNYRSCAASGACPLTVNGGTCTSYASSAPLTTCSAISSTCNDGTWSPAPGAYSTCSNPCAASGICPITASGGTCSGYSASSATGPNLCSTYALTKTCTNGTWATPLPAYSTCTQNCTTGAVTASPSTITAQSTTALSAPASWSGGSFSSSNTSVLTIVGSTGTGKLAGSATVTGTGWTDPYGTTSCSLTGTAVTVRGTYTIDPSVSASVGLTAQDHGYYDADGSGTATTTQTVTSGPTWSSSNTGIATISSSGLVTCVSAGTVTITSTYQSVTATGSAVCTVAKSCTVSSSPNPIVSGNSSSLSWSSAGVSACTWTSGLSGSAGTSGSQSVNPAVSTTYALNCDSGAATCSTLLRVCLSGAVSVTPSTATVGRTVALSAPASWTGGTFSSSNTGVLSVSGSTGTGVAAGSATVTGSNWTDPNGTTGCPLSGVSIPVVTCPVGSVTATPSTVKVGSTTALTQPAGWSSGTFSSSNSGVLSVTGSTGTGVAAGSATVTGSNWTAPNLATGCPLLGAIVSVVTCPASTVTLTPASLTAQGTTAISSTVAMTGGTFSSSNTSVLTVSGLTGTGKIAGTATVTGSGWTAANGATSCSITGTTATVLGTYTCDSPLTVTVGGTAQDHGYYDADGSGIATTTQTVTSGPTWTSSNTGVATVSSSGLITGVAAGTATITSVYQGVTATSAVTVVSCPASTVTLTPASLTAQGTTAISSTVAMTGGTFVSDNTTVMTVSGSTGTGKFAGISHISGSGWTASNGAMNCSISQATAIVSGSFTVDPSKSAIVGGTAQFNGYYDPDAGGIQPTQTVTSSAAWSSGSPSIAQSLGSGQVKCLAAGVAVITAQYTQAANSVVVTATGTMNCSAAPTCSVTLNPASVTQGNSSSLGWSSAGVSACTWTSGLSGSAGTSGSQSVNPATTTSYALNCDSGAATCSGTLTVIPPCPTGYAVTATPTGIAIAGTTALAPPSGWTGGIFSSSNNGILSVAGSTGTGVAAGSATVTGSGWSVSGGAINCSLNGTAVTVSQPTLSVNTPVYVGVGKTAHVTSIYSVDGTPGNNQDVTTQSTWSSSNSGIASSLGGGGFLGLAPGVVTMTANYATGGITATGTLAIVQCKATDITITLRSGINTPMPNVPVTLSTNVGTLAQTSGTTNAQGIFTTSLRAPVPVSNNPVAVDATITAVAQGVTLTKTITFPADSLCYANQIGMGQTGSVFALLENLTGTIFPYLHPSLLMGMAWGGDR